MYSPLLEQTRVHTYKEGTLASANPRRIGSGLVFASTVRMYIELTEKTKAQRIL